MKKELTLEEQIVEMEGKLAELKARKEEEDRNKTVVTSMYLNTFVNLDDYYKGHNIDCNIEDLNVEISERIIDSIGEIRIELYYDDNKVIEEGHAMPLYKFECVSYRAEVIKYLLDECVSKLYSIRALEIRDRLESYKKDEWFTN